MRWGVRLALLAATSVASASARADECAPSPPSREAPEQIAARARDDFDAQRWERAAAGFRDVALNHADHPAGAAAVRPYVESVAGGPAKTKRDARAPDATCVDLLARDLPRLRDLYCRDAAKNVDACSLLERVDVDLRRFAAQKLVEQADRGGSPALYEQAGTAYAELFRERCEAPVASGGAPRAEACDELGFNAMRAFGAGRKIPKAIAAGRALVALDVKTKSSWPLATQAMHVLAGLHRGVGEYASAAEWLERFAAAQPRAEPAPRALGDAVELRLGIGDADRAAKDARLFEKAYGATRPIEAAAALLAVATYAVEHEAWSEARATLAPSLALFDKAPADLRLRAHVLLARAHAHTPGGAASAAKEYALVRDGWAQGRVVDTIVSARRDDGDPMRYVALALAAVGEALVADADERRVAEVEPRRAPAFKGADARRFEDHLRASVAPWLKDKIAAIDAVSSAYAKVADLRPFAPPAAMAAASARVAAMWTDLADDVARIAGDFRTKDARARAAFAKLLSARRDPVLARAKAAARACMDVSAKYAFRDERTSVCERWLARNFREEHHAVDEILPTFASGAPAARARPLSRDGTPSLAPLP